MNPNKALWEKGDFTEIAAFMRQSGEVLVKSLGITTPMRILDLTLSVFGAMFAPKPFDVARELVRVTKPGGRIVMGNWIPNDPTSFVSQLLKISSSFTPPPPEGFVSDLFRRFYGPTMNARVTVSP